VEFEFLFLICLGIKSQNSVYQQGFGMIFCNPAPIATAWYEFKLIGSNFHSYLGREAVSSAIQAFVTAVTDLTRLGKRFEISINIKEYDRL